MSENLWPGAEAEDARRKDAAVVVVEVAAQSSGDRLQCFYRYGQINGFNGFRCYGLNGIFVFDLVKPSAVLHKGNMS